MVRNRTACHLLRLRSRALLVSSPSSIALGIRHLSREVSVRGVNQIPDSRRKGVIDEDIFGGEFAICENAGDFADARGEFRAVVQGVAALGDELMGACEDFVRGDALFVEALRGCDYCDGDCVGSRGLVGVLVEVANPLRGFLLAFG